MGGVKVIDGGEQAATTEKHESRTDVPADTLRVRVRRGAPSFFTGTPPNRQRVSEGMEIPDMPVQQARAAAQWLEEVRDDGSTRPIPHERQDVSDVAAVPRAMLVGRPRHERIEALDNEEKQLSDRLRDVRARLEQERAALDAAKQAAEQTEQAESKKAEPKNADTPRETRDGREQ